MRPDKTVEPVLCSRKGMLLTAQCARAGKQLMLSVRYPKPPSALHVSSLLGPGRFASFHHVVTVSPCSRSTLLERM